MPNYRVPGMGGGGPTGFEDYPDWEGYADAWPGTGANDPIGVPPAIDDWNLQFRPAEVDPYYAGGGDPYEGYVDWAQGAGQDPLPATRFNDLQFSQAFGGLPARPPDSPGALAEAGYSLDYDPFGTANKEWRLNYGIDDPAGRATGYTLESADPYIHFPWVPGGDVYNRPSPPPPPPPPPPPGPPDAGPAPDTGEFTDQDIDTSVGGGVREVATDLPDPFAGNVREDPSITDYPFSVPQQQLIGMTQVGDDPISELMNASLASMATAGGVAPTGYTGQVQGALSDIMGAGGQGAEVPGELGWEAQNQLSYLMDQQGRGAERESALGQDVQATLQELIANAGRLPADAQRRAMEMETLRSPIEAFRQAQLAQGQAELARRGLMGQGPESAFMEGLEQKLAPMYAQAGRDIALSEAARADKRYGDALTSAQMMGQQQAQRREGQYQNALNQAVQQGDTAALRREDRLATTLQLATGMAEEQSRNLLATAQTWSDRQEMLSAVVQKSLDQDFLWNKFMAEYGLERDQAMEMIQSGRLNQLLPLLQTFLSQIQLAGEGFVPYYEEDEEDPSGPRGMGRTAYQTRRAFS
jgi:hypothetical protein